MLFFFFFKSAELYIKILKMIWLTWCCILMDKAILKLHQSILNTTGVVVTNRK